MTLLGLDFDNTLVRYDKLFHKLAIEKNLINADVPADKVKIRDYLRSKGKDSEFTELQGEVYGLRITEAEPAKGMLETLKKLKHKGIEMVIVSHKTIYPYKGPKYNLREAALKWLTKQEFFAHSGLNWNKSNVFFEDSKENKVEKIRMLGCKYFVDDLPEILQMLDNKTKGILYAPDNKADWSYDTIKDWSELDEFIKKPS